MHSYLQLIITVLSLNVSMFYVYTTILLCMQHVRGPLLYNKLDLT